MRRIAETDGQVEQLYDLACAAHEQRSAALEVLRLRREEHGRIASTSTYARLRRAADVVGAWEIERDAARLAQRLCLAEAREAQRPEQTLPWYMLVVDELLLETGRRPYARAIPVLKHALSVRRRGR